MEIRVVNNRPMADLNTGSGPGGSGCSYHFRQDARRKGATGIAVSWPDMHEQVHRGRGKPSWYCGTITRQRRRT